MKVLSILLAIVATVTPPAFAQTAAQEDAWRAFAQKIDVGTRVKLRLDDGQRLTATLIRADSDGMLVHPRTRVPVPVQHIAYNRIASLERDERRGIGAGKAAAVGVGSGVGAFVGILLILLATLD